MTPRPVPQDDAPRGIWFGVLFCGFVVAGALLLILPAWIDGVVRWALR